MSTVAAPPEPRLLAQARSLRAPAPEALFGTALAIVLALIGLRGGGGLLLRPTTEVEVGADLVAGLLAATAALSAGAQRWWGGASIAAFALLAAVTAVSIVWAVEPSDAWLEANRTVSYVAVFATGVLLARLGGSWLNAVLGAMVAAALVISGWALLTKVFPGSLAPGEHYARLREPYRYWNAVGLTAAMGVPPTLWLGARRTGHAVVSALAYPIMAVLLLTVLLAYSRGSLLAVAVGSVLWFAVVPLRLRGVAVLATGALGALLVTLWVFGQPALTQDKLAGAQRAASSHDLGIAAVAMVLVLAIVGLLAGFATARRAPSADARRRLGATILVIVALVPVGLVLGLALSQKGLGGSISSGWSALTDPNDQTKVGNDPGRLTSVGSVRARYWDESLKIFRAHPWKGVGADGYQTARTRYRTDQLTVRHSHGYVVQTAADLGLLGLAASGLLLLAWLLATARTLALWPMRRTPEPPTWGPERVGLATLATIVVVFGVHSFIDWTWFVPGTAIPALLCAGWVAGRGPLAELAAEPRHLGTRVSAGVRSPWRVLVAVFLLACGLTAAWTAWQPLRSANDTASALIADTGRGYPQALRLAERARDHNPLSTDPLFTLAFIEQSAGHPAAARRALTDAVRLQPSNPSTWLRLAEFELYDAKDPKLSLRLLGPALYLDPKSATGAQDYLAGIREVQQQATAAAQAEQAQQAKRAARKRARSQRR